MRLLVQKVTMALLLFTCSICAKAGDSGFGSSAQALVDPNTITVGPYPVTTNVDGYGSVLTFVTLTLREKTVNDIARVDVAIDADLGNWAIAAPQIADNSIKPEWKDNCYHPSTFGNYNVSVPNKTLMTLDPKTLRFAFDGTLSGWYCYPNPVPEVYWDGSGCSLDTPFGKAVYGCPRTRTAPDFKGMWLLQGFDASADIQILSGDGRTLKFGYNSAFELRPGRMLNDSLSLATLGLFHPPPDWDKSLTAVLSLFLDFAGVSPSQKLRDALANSIDLTKMTWSFGPDLFALGVRFDDAEFHIWHHAPSLHVAASATITPQSFEAFLDAHGISRDKFFAGGSERPPLARCTDGESTACMNLGDTDAALCSKDPRCAVHFRCTENLAALSVIIGQQCPGSDNASESICQRVTEDRRKEKDSCGLR